MEAHLAEARRLRSAELARLCGVLWGTPGALLRRIASRPTTAVPTGGMSRSTIA